MYAQKFYCGIIPENEVDMDKIAYTNDNLYDIICDKIGQLQKENSEPIPYEKNNAIKRYEQVVNIKFVNFYKIRAGIPIKKYKEKCADTVYKVYNEKISMRFDID